MSDILGKIRGADEARISRPLDLGEFDEAYRGATFEVWVAPTREHLQEWAALTEFINEQRRIANSDGMSEGEMTAAMAEYEERQLAWYAETWLNISLEEARQIRQALQQQNNLAWDWLLMKSSRMIGQFRAEKLGN